MKIPISFPEVGFNLNTKTHLTKKKKKTTSNRLYKTFEIKNFDDF